MTTEIEAPVDEAHHEGFGAGVKWADQDRDEAIAAAEARGYRKAVEALRDGKRYDEWYSFELPDSTRDISHVRSVYRRQMARYLESLTSPKGDEPDAA